MKFADIHAHVFPYKIAEKASASIGEFYHVPLRHIATMENLVEEERQAGACAFAVCSSATVAAQVAHINDFIAECIAPHDNVVGFGSLFPGMDGWEPELERLQALGIRGIKIHPDFQRVNIDEPAAVEMYRGIAKAGLPVLFHMGDDRFDYSSPTRLTNLIRQVPDLTVIAAHFGGYRAWEEAAVQAFPENVYYDTSSSLVFLGKDRALDYLDRLGADRFLFGSDYPMWTPKLELELFLSLGLDETTRDRILYGNFEKLFLR